MSAEEVVEVVESAVEESTAEIIDAVVCSLTPKQHLIRLLVVGAAAAGISGFATYYITNKRLEKKYSDISREEIEEAKKFYTVLNKKGEYSTPKNAVKKLISDTEEDMSDDNGPEAEEDEEYALVGDAVDAILKYQGKSSKDDEDKVNIYLTDERGDFDYDEEMKTRSPDNPYIIHEEEFLESVEGFSQSSITYYAGDDVLADEREQVIPASDSIVGDDNLKRFGHGSSDPRIVHVRNEYLSTDFEILLSDGKYAHEVLGLQHSDGGARGRRQQKMLHKYRDGDDE